MKKTLVFLLILLLLSGCSSFNNENKNVEIENKTIENEDKVYTDEYVELDENDFKSNLLITLYTYGTEIYESEKYLSFTKSNDVYFASLNKLQELGYDISMFEGEDGTTCNKTSSGIYFDVEYKLISKDDSFDIPIVSSLVGCSKEELEENQ